MDTTNKNPNPVQPNDSAKAQIPLPKRPLSREEILQIDLYRTRIDSSSKDLLILDQQINLIQLQKKEAEKELNSVRSEEVQYLKLLAEHIGLSTLNGWNLDVNTGQLTLKS